MTILARFALVLLVSLVPLVSGCDYRSFSIEIPGFDAFQVEGLWLWRLNEVTGQYERAGEIRLHRETDYPSSEEAEVIGFSNTSPEEIVLPAVVIRNPVDPDHVTLQLLYLNVEGPGVFKASLFNAAGESELSHQTISL